MWKTLLVPHDFSACADAALSTAVELARVHHADLVLLHVSDLSPNVPQEAHDGVLQGTSRRLESLAGPLRSEGLSVATRARIGDSCDEILNMAKDDEASVIVMGTHGRRGLARAFLGSVTERVIRRAPVPVVAVRVPGGEAEPTKEEGAAEDDLAG